MPVVENLQHVSTLSLSGISFWPLAPGNALFARQKRTSIIKDLFPSWVLEDFDQVTP